MRIRPWPIVILALTQAALPFLGWLAGTLYQGLSGRDFLQALYLGRDSYESLLFFALPLVAAIAIFAIRIWSYPTLLSAGVWAIAHYLTLHHENPQLFPAPICLPWVAIQGLLLAYFLFPRVARIYLNPQTIWWRAKPRFEMRLAAEVSGPWGHADCDLLDFSEGGAFVVASRILLLEDVVRLHFTLLGRELSIRARVTHRTLKNGNAGFGLQFRRPNREQRRKLREIAVELERSQCPRFPERLDRREGLRAWVARLVRTGQGWLPEVDGPPVPVTWRGNSGKLIPLRRAKVGGTEASAQASELGESVTEKAG